MTERDRQNLTAIVFIFAVALAIVFLVALSMQPELRRCEQAGGVQLRGVCVAKEILR